MIILKGNRCCGKTTELIKISAVNQFPIIVLNNERGNLIEHMAKTKGLKIPKPILYKSLDQFTGRGIKGILIDDVEDILSAIFWPNQIIIAATGSPLLLMDLINKEM